ncbi:hypothetical protein AURDEDRAFT_189055 [Auricularia subglabra TFB-10046 SS5]|uniref:Uncharacterized protein n=1 Tax=Auricularia subglabra (strain TFB-10046 / SS5) TaxID=717982 RepID=J0LB64_AURST|nr:hypothetical protein AURDEDRAFT_189055 [Auricularia subglabra TFB-10046 SS5]
MSWPSAVMSRSDVFDPVRPRPGTGLRILPSQRAPASSPVEPQAGSCTGRARDHRFCVPRYARSIRGQRPCMFPPTLGARALRLDSALGDSAYPGVRSPPCGKTSVCLHRSEDTYNRPARQANPSSTLARPVGFSAPPLHRSSKCGPRLQRAGHEGTLPAARLSFTIKSPPVPPFVNTDWESLTFRLYRPSFHRRLALSARVARLVLGASSPALWLRESTYQPIGGPTGPAHCGKTSTEHHRRRATHPVHSIEACPTPSLLPVDIISVSRRAEQRCGQRDRVARHPRERSMRRLAASPG